MKAPGTYSVQIIRASDGRKWTLRGQTLPQAIRACRLHGKKVSVYPAIER